MCGVVGIVSHSPVNQSIYDALTVLQHRGQDAAGIVTWGENGLQQRRANGLVRDVFRTRHMKRLTGNVGVGHVRYPTAGGSRSSEAQPFYVNSPYGICLAHNGNLTNYDELAKLLTEQDRRRRDREMIEQALDDCDGKVFGPGGAAKLLGLKPTTLASRIKRWGIDYQRLDRKISRGA